MPPDMSFISSEAQLQVVLLRKRIGCVVFISSVFGFCNLFWAL